MTTEAMTHVVWVKKPLTPEQKIELGQKMADADERLSAKSDELEAITDTFKETRKQLEGEMSAIQDELHAHATSFRRGYEELRRECVATYEGTKVSFADKDTGEIVEEREMTEAEQMRLSGNMVDAEDIIRKAREEE
jgi:hypothetical protein